MNENVSALTDTDRKLAREKDHIKTTRRNLGHFSFRFFIFGHYSNISIVVVNRLASQGSLREDYTGIYSTDYVG